MKKDSHWRRGASAPRPKGESYVEDNKDAPSILKSIVGDNQNSTIEDLQHYQSNYTFHSIAPCPENLAADANEVKYTSLQVPNARVFTLDNFLSNAECDYFLDTLKEMKFDSLANEYPEKYRNNQRYDDSCYATVIVLTLVYLTFFSRQFFSQFL